MCRGAKLQQCGCSYQVPLTVIFSEMLHKRIEVSATKRGARARRTLHDLPWRTTATRMARPPSRVLARNSPVGASMSWLLFLALHHPSDVRMLYVGRLPPGLVFIRPSSFLSLPIPHPFFFSFAGFVVGFRKSFWFRGKNLCCFYCFFFCPQALVRWQRDRLIRYK